MMKLLFDQNLSFRLVKQLELLFPGSSHVRLLGMEQRDDRFIRQFAKDKEFVIVTQDADFEWLSQIHGFPPKIIWLRCGNTATLNIRRLLETNYELILAFEIDDSLACLELS
jgi:predicted nuclease of predicted toxin-antitoxin system